MSPNHPVVARLDKLHDQWVTFARDPSARILLWRARADELALIDAFVARECDAEHADTPDLFVQLGTPFTSSHEHGHALREELCAQASEAEQVWPCPAALEDGLQSFLRALCSLHSHLAGPSDALLAIWLDPPRHDSTYALWLQRLSHFAPAQLRFIVVETGPALSALVDAEPTRVAAVPCALDMPGALDALTANGGTPGDLFRRLQVRLATQAAAGDLASAAPTTAAAVKLAREHGWSALAASVQITLATVYAAHEQHSEAITTYREAEKSAALCDEHEAALRDEIRLIALLGCASVMLGAGSPARAAELYLEGASLAADPQRELDCYRLASFCCIQQGQRERAWALGVQGLRCGVRMDKEQRASSSLPFLAQQLERIGEHGAGLERQLVELMGSNWRAQLGALA